MLRAWKVQGAHRGIAISVILSLTLLLPLAACNRFHTQTPEQHIQNAVQYRAKGDLNAAVIELKNALQQQPDNARARLLLGRTYVEGGQPRSAEKELRRALSLGIKEEEVDPELARALLMQGRYQEALDKVKFVQQEDPDRRADALVTRGDAEQALGKTDLACTDYEQASKLASGNLSAKLGIAICDVLRNRLDQARERVKKLVQDHPENIQSWILLGRIEGQAKNNKAAHDAFSKALDLDPKQPVALLGRAQIELTEGQLQAAEVDIEALHKLSPSSLQANYLLGLLRYRQGRYNDAAVALQDALRANPGFDPAVLWLALTNYAQHNYEQATRGFSRFLQNHPDAVRIRVLLALSQTRLGGDDAAAQTLRQLQGVDIEDPKMLAAIGQAALSAGDLDSGRHYFEKAVALAPDKAAFRTALASVMLQSGDATQAIEELDMASKLDRKDIRPDVVLIRTLIAKRQFDQALQAIDRVEKKVPESDLPHVLRGLVFLLQKKDDEARKAFELALKKDPSSIGGHHGLAILDIKEHDFDAAHKHYQAILDAHPGNLQTELALSGLAVRAGDQAKALGWLKQAVKDNPKSPIASGLYARELLAQGKPREALQVTQAALDANPKHMGLLYLRGVALFADGEIQDAADTYQQLVDAHPKFIPARLQLAQARERLGDTAGARKVLTEALEISPHHLGATVALLQLETRAKNFDQALKLSHEIDQRYPKSPLGRLLEAQVLLQQGKQPEAIATLQSAAKAHPQAPVVIQTLARLQWSAGEREKSTATLATWLKTHPDDLKTSRELADGYLLMGRHKAAADLYEKIRKVDPKDAVVLNNLALARWPGDRAQALEIARQANRLHPESPAIQDTLGWMLVEEGQTKEGLPLLESARKQLGNSPSVHYHYAVALVRAGRQAAARQELKNLLAQHKSFPEKEDATALLDKL